MRIGSLLSHSVYFEQSKITASNLVFRATTAITNLSGFKASLKFDRQTAEYVKEAAKKVFRNAITKGVETFKRITFLAKEALVGLGQKKLADLKNYTFVAYCTFVAASIIAAPFSVVSSVVIIGTALALFGIVGPILHNAHQEAVKRGIA